MNNKKGFIKILLVIIAIIAVALIVYLRIGSRAETISSNISNGTASSDIYSSNKKEALDLKIYLTPEDKSHYGNYKFNYPEDISIEDDYIYTDVSWFKKHVVLLERLIDKEMPEDFSGKLVVEINIRSQCKHYLHCKNINGVVVGTNGEDEDFLRSFSIITSSFEVLTVNEKKLKL